jgi:two-component system response regulator
MSETGPDQTPDQAPDRANQERVTKAKRILLVEDNADDAALTLRALRKTAILSEITWVRDGAEALDYLFHTGKYGEAARPELPTLVILDLKLPKIDGLEVLRRLRANASTQTIPVVVLTSSKEQRDVHRSYAFGANSYIHKQIDFVKFTETVQQLKSYWLNLNEAPPVGDVPRP